MHRNNPARIQEIAGDMAVDRSQENLLRNLMMNKLDVQEELPPGPVDLLVGIYTDHDQDVVMRDYAVQHLSPIYGQVSPQERELIGQTLWRAVAEKDSSLAGTAPIAMNVS